MTVTILLIWCILIFLMYRLIKYIQRVKILSRIPGPRYVFPYGNVHLFMKSPYEDLDKLVKKMLWKHRHNSVALYWTYYHPTVMILKASAAEAVLRSSKDITKNIAYKVLGKWLGEGLLTSTGQKWLTDRKMLTPTFHFQILNTFMDIFNKKSEILVENLRCHADNNDTFDLFPNITLCTLDAICEAAMGKDIKAQTQKDSAYVKAIVDMSEIAAHRITSPWLLFPAVYYFTRWYKREKQCLEILHNFTDQVIKERREERITQKNKNFKEIKAESFGVKTKSRFLDMLLDVAEINGHVTDLAIREQVDTFMFEGHDTTACSLSWTLYFLGRHPQVLAKVHSEIDDIFMDDKSRLVSTSDLNKMKYLEAVIKESMRMIPIVPLFGRQLDSDLTLGGYKVPKGTDIMIVPYYVHHDPEIYDEPYTFDPERFLNDNKTGRHPYGFLGFSAGPRNCIGQKFAMLEEKVVLAHVLRHYSIVAKDDLDHLKIGTSLVSKPLNGIYVNLQHRQ
ncbi:Cytochrome P450 4V2 [Chamberlinius hualienensis]